MAQATNYLIELKLALEQRGMKQVQLARRLHCTPAHISRIVRGHVTPNARDRKRIAQILGRKEAALFSSKQANDVPQLRPIGDIRSSIMSRVTMRRA